jgi:hypothetical protein
MNHATKHISAYCCFSIDDDIIIWEWYSISENV